jgi:hypothetical protein
MIKGLKDEHDSEKAGKNKESSNPLIMVQKKQDKHWRQRTI